MKQARAYGSWESPISTDTIVTGTIGLGEIQLTDDAIYWLEMRPEEKGRYVVVKYTDQEGARDFSPEDLNARTRVHEYGGGSFLAADESLFLTHFSDQVLYRAECNKTAQAITVPGVDQRFADFIFDVRRSRLISVLEMHNGEGEEPENCIAAITVDDQANPPVVLVRGADFYSNPRLSPDGKQLCWLSWHHPNMPWDNTECWLADIADDGSLKNERCIAGKQGESIFQPEWSPAGELVFVSDVNGWWNLYRWQGNQAECLLQRNAEFGVAQWSFRESTYAFRNTHEIVCTWTEAGQSQLGLLNIQQSVLQTFDLPYTDIESVQANATQAVFLGSAPTVFPEIVSLDLDSGNTCVLRRASELSLDREYLSIGQAIEYPTTANRTAHAFYYAPVNRDYTGPDEELPPLLVCSHGGPTGMARNGLKLVFQFFTSRGIAVLDVNYGGSSGYGRAYRQSLQNAWGIVDVDDCIQGALYLAEQGKVDRERLGIRGGSAGGFTTLAALTFHDVFKAGASRYGVSDLEALAQDTHKFESRYLDGLIGPYPAANDVYKQRSPIHAVDKLSCPIIFLQGLEDKIVLPNQSEMMVDALKRKGLPVAYLAFSGEQHGFRQAANIKRALDAEYYFFGKVFGFTPADSIEPVAIYNSEYL